jgi:integrase
MAATKGHRSWGWVRKLPSGRYQASYEYAGIRHYAAATFSAKLYAEGWLSTERQAIELGTWTAPSDRQEQKKTAKAVQVLTLADYAKAWIQHRNVKPRTRIEYESILDRLIIGELGALALVDLTPETVRAWYAGLGREAVRRNSHAYGLLHAICATAVKDGKLIVNPCQIERVMNPPTKREPVILTVGEVAALAEAMPERLTALVLISSWCGLRWGEVIELRRRDIGSGCESISVSRAVTHRGTCRIDSPKSGKGRVVMVPPHIRADIKAHLDIHTEADPNALLFTTAKNACHLNETTFRRSAFHPALKSIGRQGVRIHDLRHFAGTQAARVGNLVETMNRLGHSTAKASLIYQGMVSGRDAELAEALSALATKPKLAVVADGQSGESGQSSA